MKYLLAVYLIFSVFMSSMILLFYQNSNRILFAATEQHILSFSFKNDIDLIEAEKISAELKKKYPISNVTLHSPKDQYTQFAKSFSMYNEGAFDPDEIIRLIPVSVDFSVLPEQNISDIKKLLLSENIFDQQDSNNGWAQKFQSVGQLIENMGRFLFLFLFLGAALMTASTVRILISTDEPKIKIRSYLGESFTVIARRYLIKTLALCFFGIVIGFLANYFVYQYFLIQMKLHPEFSFVADRFHFLDLKAVMGIFLGFCVAITAGAYLTLKQLRDRIYDSN